MENTGLGFRNVLLARILFVLLSVNIMNILFLGLLRARRQEKITRISTIPGDGTAEERQILPRKGRRNMLFLETLP